MRGRDEGCGMVTKKIATAGAVAATVVAAVGAAARKRIGLHVVPRTMFGPAVIRNARGDNGERIRALQVGGAFQSATYLDERRFEPCFEYYRAFDHLFEANIPMKNILMLGGGGFAYPKHVMSTRPNIKMTVVERDPAVVKIAKRWFFVDELIKKYDLEKTERLKIEVADAREFVAAAPQHSYDAVINDCFEGTLPVASLLTKAALLEAKRVLVDGGVYMLNAVIFPQEKKLLNTFMELLAEAFAYVCAIPCIDEEFSGADNYLIVGSDAMHSFSGANSFLLGSNADPEALL